MHVASSFSVIVDDFDEELTSLGLLIEMGQARGVPRRTRVASINATTLMLAATFEEFIRQMAREKAIQVVNKARSVVDVPDRLLETAWKQTLAALARAKANGRSKREALRVSVTQARPKIDALCSFVEGDIKQDIYDHLIHNDYNMRPDEINKMFKISGQRSICHLVCQQASLKIFFDREDEDETHRDLKEALNHFINHRNEITHSLNSATSIGSEDVFRVIEMFRAFAKGLGAALEPVVD